MSDTEGNPKRLTYALTAILAIAFVAILFSLFSALLSFKVFRAVMALFLAISISFPLSGILQDAIVFKHRGS